MPKNICRNLNFFAKKYHLFILVNTILPSFLLFIQLRIIFEIVKFTWFIPLLYIGIITIPHISFSFVYLINKKVFKSIKYNFSLVLVSLILSYIFNNISIICLYYSLNIVIINNFFDFIHYIYIDDGSWIGRFYGSYGIPALIYATGLALSIEKPTHAQK
ncbi:hypothetical protein BISA_2044 [Bifidobacterium saguini DSM 23967]|uniref:Uncharacterized protein n=2 Tax=Bifidobacterium TaxID=1678 RepID=A0A087D8X0_9BIFI|nr:hypothetical protein BISA_2044 [Bifidobacterium saguini DSM 23967]PLS24311.1 hypothetical protein Tam1G_1574 [Bifidobacterium imperatoris]